MEASSEYFSFSDTVITYSGAYGSYSPRSSSSSLPASKQGVIISSGPSTTPSEFVDRLVKGQGLRWVFVTDSGDFQSLPSDMGGLVRAVAGAGGGQDRTSTPSSGNSETIGTSTATATVTVTSSGSIGGSLSVTQTVSSVGGSQRQPKSGGSYQTTSSPGADSNSNSGPGDGTGGLGETNSDKSSGKGNVGAIVAGVLVPVVVILLVLCVWMRRRARRRGRLPLRLLTPTPMMKPHRPQFHDQSGVDDSENLSPIPSSATPTFFATPFNEKQSRSSSPTQEGLSAPSVYSSTPSELSTPPATRRVAPAEMERLRQENQILREQTQILLRRQVGVNDSLVVDSSRGGSELDSNWARDSELPAYPGSAVGVGDTR